MKKNVMLIIGSVVVVLALAAALIFAFGDFGAEPETETTNLTGTWIVAATYANDAPTMCQDQFMVFTESNASVYVGNMETPYATGSYTINEAQQLQIPDIGREYRVEVKTDRCVRLYDSPTTYMLLIRNAVDELRLERVDAQVVAGSWNIAMKGDQLNQGERLEFAGSELKYYRSGAAEPVVAEFAMDENGVLTAATLGLSMQCYQTAQQGLAFVETNGTVWELAR